jgi:hypothetical protein
VEAPGREPTLGGIPASVWAARLFNLGSTAQTPPTPPRRPAPSATPRSLPRAVSARPPTPAPRPAVPAPPRAPATARPAPARRLIATHSSTAPSPLDKASPRGRGSSPQEWGGLPAPWEPLPGWLEATSTGEQLHSPFQALAADTATAEPSATRPQTQAEPDGHAAPPAQVEPDLDALARQVYTILNRRLDLERRRLG